MLKTSTDSCMHRVQFCQQGTEWDFIRLALLHRSNSIASIILATVQTERRGRASLTDAASLHTRNHVVASCTIPLFFDCEIVLFEDEPYPNDERSHNHLMVCSARHSTRKVSNRFSLVKFTPTRLSVMPSRRRKVTDLLDHWLRCISYSRVGRAFGNEYRRSSCRSALSN